MKPFFRSQAVTALLLVSSLLFSSDCLAQLKQSSQRTVEGFVFVGKDVEFPGAIVTDGFTVVKTGTAGEFSIPLNERARFITLTTPDGYRHITPFYISVDSQEFIFVIEEEDRKPGHFIHFSDSEDYEHRDWIERLREYVETNDPSFVVMSGDICYERGMWMHANEVSSEKMGCRMVYTLGNHDLVKGYTDYLGNEHGEQLFETLFGPVWYSFNSDGVHNIVFPMMSGDAKPSYTPSDVYRWMKKDLEMIPEGMPVLLFSHIIPVDYNEFVFRADGVELDMREYNLKGAFHGHHHFNGHYRSADGIDIYCSNASNKGGVDHSPSSFRRVWFDMDGNIESELIYNILDKHVVFNPFFSGEMVEVVATVYDSSSDLLSANALINGEEISFKKVEKNAFTWTISISKEVFEREKRIDVIFNFSDGEVVVRSLYPPGFYENPRSPLNLEWVATIPATTAFTAPVIAGDLLLVAGTDDDKSEQCGIYAIDKDDGTLVNFFHTNASVKNRMIYENGVLYVCDIQMNLYAIDVENFELLWKRSYNSDPSQNVYTEGIAYDQGRIFIGRGDKFRAVDASNGDEIWKNTQWSGGTSGVTENIVANGVVVTNAYWTGHYAHDVKTGALLWRKNDALNRYADSSPVLMDDGNIIWFNQTAIEIFEPRTGKVLKSVETGLKFASRSRPLITEELIIIGTYSDGISAYDRESLKQRWNYKTNPALIYTGPYSKDYQMTVEGSPILCGEFVLTAANDGYLYLIDTATGQYRWRYNLGLPSLNDPVSDGEAIWIVDMGGKVFKFGVENRKIIK